MSTNWKEQIQKTMLNTGDSFDNLVFSTMSKEELEEPFTYNLWGKPFTLWTKDYVYFPLTYNGYDSAGYAPRNPQLNAIDPQGSYD